MFERVVKTLFIEKQQYFHPFISRRMALLIIALRYYCKGNFTTGWGYHSWIGSMKENGTWEWYGRLKGPVNLGYWAPKQPSSKDHHLCMVTWMPYDYYWDDHPCTSEVFFACEKKI